MPLRDRYSIARLIGRLLHLRGETVAGTLPQPPRKNVMLIGPGRWGTTTPSLGVPVHFAEINTVAVLCEIVAMRDDLVPDVSLGTHFFNDLVEKDMLYLALFPKREGNYWNDALLDVVAQPAGRTLARRCPLVRSRPGHRPDARGPRRRGRPADRQRAQPAGDLLPGPHEQVDTIPETPAQGLMARGQGLEPFVRL